MAEIVCFTGQSFEAVERMTWPNYLSLLKHWSRWPPTAISCAFAAGLAPQQRETTESPGELSDDDVALLMSLSS